MSAGEFCVGTLSLDAPRPSAAGAAAAACPRGSVGTINVAGYSAIAAGAPLLRVAAA